MQEILVYSCFKGEDFDNTKYIKSSQKWANIKDINKFNPQIAKAQSGANIILAKKSYENAYLPYINGFCIALDENGEKLNSQNFAKLLTKYAKINFFIGGAYGFSDEFKSKMDFVLSLSNMTMAHKVAKLVLFEQIYRALSINANHPYHKGE